MPGSSTQGAGSLDAKLARVVVAKRQRGVTNAVHERKAGFYQDLRSATRATVRHTYHMECGDKLGNFV
jgi:hypothetical protein